MGNFWIFINGIYQFIIDFYGNAIKLWNFTFKIGDMTLQFSNLVGGALITLIGLMLIKKFI